MIFIVTVEGLFAKLMEVLIFHIQFRHRDRDKELYYAKTTWKMSKPSCQIFISHCKTLNRKLVAPKKRYRY